MELATSDSEAAFDFYSKLFGWQAHASHGHGPAGRVSDLRRRRGAARRHLQAQPGALVAAVLAAVRGSRQMPMPPPPRPAQPVARSSSARMDVPGGGRIAQLIDPNGAPVRGAFDAGRQPAAPPPAVPARRLPARHRLRAGRAKAVAARASRAKPPPRRRRRPGPRTRRRRATCAGRANRQLRPRLSRQGGKKPLRRKRSGCQEAGCQKGGREEEKARQEGGGRKPRQQAAPGNAAAKSARKSAKKRRQRVPARKASRAKRKRRGARSRRPAASAAPASASAISRS